MEKKLRLYVDDGNVKDLKIAELFDKHGFKGIFYIAPYYSQITPMSVEQIRNLSKNHEIGGHTLNHALLTEMSKEDQISEIKKGKEELEEVIGKKIYKFAYPKGWFNPEVKKSVEECGFKEGRTVKMGVTDIIGYDEFEIPVTAHMYPRKEYAKKGVYQSIIDKYNEGNYFGLLIHGNEIERFNYWDMLEKILIYINEDINKKIRRE